MLSAATATCSQYYSTPRVQSRKMCPINPLLQQLDWLPINKYEDEKVLKITFTRRTASARHTFWTCLTRKYMFAPLGQLMVTVLQSFYWNSIRSVTNLLAQLDLDCGMTFHFEMAHKSAPMPTRHLILYSPSFLSQGRLLLRFLICLACSINCSWMWNVGFPLPTESPSDYVHAIEKLSSVTTHLFFVTLCSHGRRNIRFPLSTSILWFR